MYDSITSATTTCSTFAAPPQIAGQKRKRSRTLSTSILPTPQPKHPYLSGNFAPVQQTVPLTKCTYTGIIPPELADGEYVRNGSNPVSNDDLGRDAHWFDGDGMLAGVLFRKTGEHDGQDSFETIEPEFVNQYILTDLYLSTLSSPRLRIPILPSIATLVNPVASIIYVTLRILRTVLLVILSHLPGSLQKIEKISVANTSVVYHDGRAMALCESGPPMRIQLPELETVGWYDGAEAENEPPREKKDAVEEKTLGQDGGLISFMREWTTAHPKIDPKTKEMLMFHSSFAPPYVQYSIIPQQPSTDLRIGESLPKMLNAPVSGIHGAKMMHDFGVSSTHTVIMDLPLTLDPVNQLKGLPPVAFDSSKPSRFGVFPRRQPSNVQWFETDASCIFHTANTWDTLDHTGQTSEVNMLACRLTSATMVFAAGNIAPPVEAPPKTVAAAKQRRRRMPFFSKYNDATEPSYYETSPLLESPDQEKEALLDLSDLTPRTEEAAEDFLFEEDQCRLYYFNFDLTTGNIAHQWALSAIPFEFPSVHPRLEMQDARYVYGCSTTTTSFGSALGKATKIDALVKVDVKTLIARGQAAPPRSVSGIVDRRTMAQVLQSQDAHDPISVFTMPDGWFAQEPRFVPARRQSTTDEDDGYLLFYAFDESQLDPATGDVPLDSGESRAKSELWVVDAKGMKDVVCRVHLPQRVPYGLHGGWFDKEQIGGQRPVERVRSEVFARGPKAGGWWMGARDWVEAQLG